MNLTVETEREEDGRWIAEIPELPGVLAYGPDRDQAVARGVLLVKGAHLLARQRKAELGPQPSRMLAVMMRFHRTYINCTTMNP